MPWKPSQPGEVPTLGYEVIDWMTAMLAAPSRPDELLPFTPYLEQEDFILRWYEIDPDTGRFRYQRGLLGRPRGWGKSPLLAALAIAEALGPVLFDGWDSEGQPVARPWSSRRTPLVNIAAVSEEQTKNTWQPLLEMLRGPNNDAPVLYEYPGLEPMDTFVALPSGSIRQITSSARTTKGAPLTFAVLDQTEEWVPSNGGPRLAQTIRTNAGKNGGRTLESPNAFIPGEGSVAEQSAAFAAAIREGRSRADGLLYDHREAPADTDMSDRVSLTHGLRVVYGDSSAHPDGCLLHDPPCVPGHHDIESDIQIIWDTATDVQIARSDYLNQITHASDSWISQPEWSGVFGPDAVVADRDVVVLGFDGSRKRNRGVTDATALVGCRVSDGHLFEVGVWEQPSGPAGADWQVPAVEVDAAVRSAFKRWSVVGLYADPAKWESYVAKWEADFGGVLQVKSTRDHPMEWWMTGGRAAKTVQALDQFRTAVVERELSHDGSSALTRHVLNARMRSSRSGAQIAKSHPDSADKIDAAVAAVLAWACRMDAVAAGVSVGPKRRGVVRRLY